LEFNATSPQYHLDIGGTVNTGGDLYIVVNIAVYIGFVEKSLFRVGLWVM
jgi:hypothetical protein